MIIDKLRLRYKLRARDLNLFGVSVADSSIYETSEETYTGSRIGNFTYLFTYKRPEWESSIAIMQGFITLGKIDYRVFQIEFNPNKHRIPTSVFRYLNFSQAVLVDIVSMDVAFDLPNIISTALFVDVDGHSDIMTYGNALSPFPTIYVHPKALDGRIKIYDKKRERERLGGVDTAEPEKTRVEITFRSVGFLLEFDIMRYPSDLFVNFDSQFSRLKQMISQINQVKIPSFPSEINLKSENFSLLKKQNLFVIDNFLALSRCDLAKKFISLLPVNSRKSYLAYLSRSFTDLYTGTEFQLCNDLNRLLKTIFSDNTLIFRSDHVSDLIQSIRTDYKS